MSLLIPCAPDLNDKDQALIASAYERACDQLVEQHGYSSEDLAAVIEPMVDTLIRCYRAGEKNEEGLARYAVAYAIRGRRQHA